MDELQIHFAQWKKLGTKDHTLYNSAYKEMTKQGKYIGTESRFSSCQDLC